MSLLNLMAEKPSAMDGKEFGFKDRRPGRDPGGAEGGSSSAFSTPRWRQSNSGPRGFIAHCSERKSISGAAPVSPVSLISSQLDKNSGGSNDVDQSSIGWQPRKWIRPCSLLSKTATAEATGVEVESVAGEENPIKSPVACPLLSNEDTPRKKQRLAWGQGLAKFEKKKVEVPPDSTGNSSLVNCASNSKVIQDDTGTKSIPEGTSPITPGSVASPAGLVQKPCIKDANKNDVRAGGSSQCHLPGCSEKFPIKLIPLEASVISNLASVLADLLKPEDACCGDSSFTSHTATTKLLELKGDISKELENTESEIDLLENELKTLNADVNNDPCRNPFTRQLAYSSGSCLVSSDITLKMPLDLTEDASKDRLVSVLRNSENSSSVKCISDFGALQLTGCDTDNREILATDCDLENVNCLDAAGRSFVYADKDMSSNNTSHKNLVALIMASNQNISKEATKVFDKVLSTDPLRHENWRSDYRLSCRKNLARVKEKLAMHKHVCKIKERLLGLKFSAFQHLWKEDLRLLSVRKNKSKSQKQCEASSRSSQSISQRHRSSVRSRFMLPAGNLTLVPISEIVEFTSKLLLNSQIRLYRKSTNMPVLILDEMEKKYSRYISYNGLIEDPTTFEKERAMLNPWTHEEREVFMESLATFGKNFTKISSCLFHKTTADCVEFYYKNHKSEIFKDVKKRLDPRKLPQGVPSKTYLVTSRKNLNRDACAASLDMLGEVSVAAALRESSSLERASSAEISRHERETDSANVLAGNCGDLSSEAMSSCVTSSVYPAEKMIYAIMDRSSTPQAIPNFDEEDTSSDEGCGELNSVDWTDEEMSLLVKAVGMYGMDFARISHFVGTRSREQCKVFFSKARKSLDLDAILPGSDIRAEPIIDMDGGQSDTDDAFAHEMVSETDTQSGQYEMGGTDHEDVVGTVDRHAPVLDDRKLAKEPENSQSDKFMDDATLNWNEDIQFQEVTQLLGGKSGDSGNDLELPPVRTVVTTSIEATPLGYCAGDQVHGDTGGSYPVSKPEAEVVSQPFLVHEFVDRQQIKADNEVVNSESVSFPYDSNEPGIKALASPRLTFVPNYQQQLPGERLSYLQITPHIQLKQESSTNIPLDKMLLNPSSITFEDFEQGNNQNQHSVAKGFYNPCLMGNQSSNQVNQPLPIFGGYPLQVLNPEDMNSETNHTSKLQVHGISQPNQFLLPDMNGDTNSTSHLLRSHSQTSCRETGEQSHRTGDVRLFGQILSQPSSQQKPTSSSEDCGNSPPPMQHKSLTMKPSNCRTVVATSSGPGSSEKTSQVELPLRSYGFWDGNRIQTGYSSLPESAVMTANFQGPHPSNSGVMTDYHQAYMQTLAAGGKWLDSFPELPQQNGFDQVSGFQQEGRVVLGANMTAGSTILGGARGGVSDPVAALRLHYARRSKIVKSEVQSWRDDLGGVQ